MEIPGLGEITESDVKSIAYSRIHRKNLKWLYVSLMVPLVFAILVFVVYPHVGLLWVRYILASLVVLSLVTSMWLYYGFVGRGQRELVNKWRENHG